MSQHPASLWLLPGPDNLGARLAMFLLAILLTGIVLLVLTALDMAGLAPVDMRQTFVWVVFCASLLLLVLTCGLWWVITREVLRPLEQIRRETLGERGLGQVAATMRELREEVHRTQAELDESNRNLRHVEKLSMVGKLAAGVAHSVRNPLTSVKLRLFSLERGLTLDERSREDFAVIADAIKHVDGIVSSFLEFSRRPNLKLERVSPSAVVDASLRLIESRLVVFPVTLTVRRASKPLPDVLADPEQLREALLNILLNACEAMDYDGGLEVEELLVSGGGSALFACIRIRDSGPGIPKELLPDIFTPFFSTKEQGTGLGLPIAKGILEEHGGDIQVESTNAGTAFSLLLPLEGPGLPRRHHRADIAAPV
jgi:signal transduction histidine kinase